MLLLLHSIFFACIPTPSASLSSFIQDESGQSVINANIEIYDIEGALFSSTVSDEQGEFLADLPPLQTFFAVLSHPDFMTTAHTGFAGEGKTDAEDPLKIESPSSFALRQAQYSDCSIDGGYIEGEVRVAIPEQEIEDLPIVTAARATAFDLNYVGTPACYIDPDPDIPQTGESGRYLISNLPVGVHEVLLTVQYDAQTQKEFYYLVYVPSNGIAPLFPTLIPL